MTLCSLAAGLLIFAAGCAGSIPAASVYGAYRADYPFGHQTLTLRADGTYDQQVVIKQPTGVASHSGRFRYDEAAGFVFIEHCLSVTDGFGGLNPKFAVPVSADCAKPVERRLLWVGGVRIGGEEGDLFIKQ
jgi:hypothetical protein